MKHHEDDGMLTFFAEGQRGLIACSQGHYWVFTVERHEAPGAQDESRESTDEGALSEFGPAVLEALRTPDGP